MLLLFSWQMGTAALVLLSMSAVGYIDLNISPVNRQDVFSLTVYM